MMKKYIACLLAAILLLTMLPASASAEGGMQACHRVTAKYTDSKQSNKSGIRLWSVKTALTSVDDEINGLAQAYADKIAPTLQAGKANGDKNSRLDVEIRHSKTGLTWMSFLAQVLSDEGLRNLDFTLHGMSLVIHLSADAFYPEHHTLIETTLFYPDIREYMTEKAQVETDNLSYYKTVALTFDDGPTRTNSTKVLNSLMEVGAPATFFMIGKNMKPYADLVQRAHDEGHAVASHNWTHGDARKISAATLRAMPEKVNNALISIIGIPTRYDRVPYGVYPAMIKAKVGWSYIQWSVDTYDWRGRSTSLIMSKTKKQFTDGDIVLMHDIKDNTPNTAKVMAEWLYEQGYILLTVDELFAKDGVTLEPDTVYFRCDDGVTTIKK